MGLFNIFNSSNGLKNRIPVISNYIENLNDQGNRYKISLHTKTELMYNLSIKNARKITSTFILHFRLTDDLSCIALRGVLVKTSIRAENISTNFYLVENDTQEDYTKVMEIVNKEISENPMYMEILMGLDT